MYSGGRRTETALKARQGMTYVAGIEGSVKCLSGSILPTEFVSGGWCAMKLYTDLSWFALVRSRVPEEWHTRIWVRQNGCS